VAKFPKTARRAQTSSPCPNSRPAVAQASRVCWHAHSAVPADRAGRKGSLSSWRLRKLRYFVLNRDSL